jgi:hypothetical protein
MQRHGMHMPRGLTPDLTERLHTKRRATIMTLGYESVARPTAVYHALEDIPKPVYLEFANAIQQLFPERDQLAQHLLADQDQPVLGSLLGRLRTLEAVQQALEPSIDELLRWKSSDYNARTIDALHNQGIHTIKDLFGLSVPKEVYTRFKETYRRELEISTDAVIQTLMHLPHVALAADALRIGYRSIPTYLNNAAGLRHETALREVIETLVARIPEPYATVLTLRYLYQGVGLHMPEVSAATGHVDPSWAQQPLADALRMMRSPDTIAPDITRPQAIRLVLCSGYTDIQRILQEGDQERELLREYRQHVQTTLRQWKFAHDSPVIDLQLAQVLNISAGKLDGHMLLHKLRIPHMQENLDIRRRVIVFNRFIGKVYRLGGETLDDVRTLNYDAERVRSFLNRPCIAQAMFEAPQRTDGRR